MIFILLICVASATAYPGYADSGSNSVRGGYGYGYSGSFSGTSGGDGYPPVSGSGFNPVPPIGPGGDFDLLFNGYFDQLQSYLNNGGRSSYSIAYANNNAHVNAQSSITFVDNLGLQRLQHQGGQSYGTRGGFNGYGGTDGSSIASASIGPQGYSQTAAVYPENPANPNIFSRFGGVSPPGGAGSYGVFTSSVSSSSTDADGKPHNYQKSTTTVNDNGKVTTYTVKNP